MIFYYCIIAIISNDAIYCIHDNFTILSLTLGCDTSPKSRSAIVGIHDSSSSGGIMAGGGGVDAGGLSGDAEGQVLPHSQVQLLELSVCFFFHTLIGYHQVPKKSSLTNNRNFMLLKAFKLYMYQIYPCKTKYLTADLILSACPLSVNNAPGF